MTPIKKLNDEFSEANSDLVDSTEDLFRRLCAAETSAWHFYNTLSYMEHIGSYKIMASQAGSLMDYQTLKHLNEETGHAVLFKRHANRCSNERLDYSEPVLLAPASARIYFAKLEIFMVRALKDRMNSRTVYLYMSLIIEFRAVWAYRLLQQVIEDAGQDVSLSALLAEEQGHLYSMARRLEADGDFDAELIRLFCRYEKYLFARLMKSIDTKSMPAVFSPPHHQVDNEATFSATVP